MHYKATQVYLDPETHARLKAEARRRGISLAALIRELASAHVAAKAPSYDKDWDAIMVGPDTGRATDVAHEQDRYESQAIDALFEKKMAASRTRRRAPSKRR